MHTFARRVVAGALALLCVILPHTAYALSDPWVGEAEAVMVCDQAGNERW